MKKKNILYDLFVKLVKLHKEIIASDLKLLVILEGREAAGKYGTIKRIIKHITTRDTKVVALGKPSDFQEREWYFQHYTAHLQVITQPASFRITKTYRCHWKITLSFGNTGKY